MTHFIYCKGSKVCVYITRLLYLVFICVCVCVSSCSNTMLKTFSVLNTVGLYQRPLKKSAFMWTYSWLSVLPSHVGGPSASHTSCLRVAALQEVLNVHQGSSSVLPHPVLVILGLSLPSQALESAY